MVERVNGTLEKIIKKLVIDQPNEWSLFIGSAVLAYSIGYHSSTKHLPFQPLYV